MLNLQLCMRILNFPSIIFKITKCRKPSLFSTPMNYVALFLKVHSSWSARSFVWFNWIKPSFIHWNFGCVKFCVSYFSRKLSFGTKTSCEFIRLGNLEHWTFVFASLHYCHTVWPFLWLWKTHKITLKTHKILLKAHKNHD